MYSKATAATIGQSFAGLFQAVHSEEPDVEYSTFKESIYAETLDTPTTSAS